MSLKKANVSTEGVLEKSRRNSAKMLACVMALALVACAIVAFVPNAEESDAVTPIISGDETPIYITDGTTDTVLVGGQKYIVTGDATAIVNNDGKLSDGDVPNVTVILMAGASLTIDGTEVTANSPTVTVYSAVSDVNYDTINNIKFTAIDGETFEATVSAPATYTPGNLSGKISVEFVGESSTTTPTIGTDVTVAIGGEVDLIGKVGAGTTAVSGLVYDVKTEEGSSSPTITYYGDAENFEITSSTSDIKYYINTDQPVLFQNVTGTGNEKVVNYGFTVALNKGGSEVNISFTGGVPTFDNDQIASSTVYNAAIELVSGKYTTTDSTAVPGMTAAVSITDYSESNKITYYANDTDADLDGLGTGDVVTIWELSARTVIGGTANEITNSVTVAAGTYAGATVTYTEGASGSVKVTGELDIVTYSGTLASNGDNPLNVMFGYATKDSAKNWSYFNEGFKTVQSPTDGTTYLIKEVDDAAVATISGITLSTDFASTDFQVKYTTSTTSISGTWTSGTVTLTGDVSVIDGTSPIDVIALTVPTTGGSLVISGTVNVTVPAYAKLIVSNADSIAPADGATASITMEANGAIEGAINLDEVTVTVPKTNLDSAKVEFDYLEVSSTNVILKVLGAERTVSASDPASWMVLGADSEFSFGTTADSEFTANVTFGANFASSDGVTVAYDGTSFTVTGTYSGDMTVDTVTLGSADAGLTVGVVANTTASPAVEATEGTLTVKGVTTTGGAVTVSTEGTLTVAAATSATTSDGGKLTIGSEKTLTNNGTINNNGTIVATGTLANQEGAVVNDNGVWTGSTTSNITNAGAIVVNSAKADALDVAGYIASGATGTVASAVENPAWSYNEGTLTLNGDVQGQYFDATISTIAVVDDSTIDVTNVEGATSVITGFTDLTIKLATGEDGKTVAPASLTITASGKDDTNVNGVFAEGAIAVTGVDLNIDVDGTAISGTTVTLGEGDSAVTENINIDIVGGVVGTTAVHFKNVTGTIVGSVECTTAITISYSDLVITATDGKEAIVYYSEGEPTYGTLGIVDSNLNLQLPEDASNDTALTIVTADSKYSDTKATTIIVDGLDADAAVNSLIVVTGGLYSNSGSGTLYAYNGIDAKPLPGKVYLYGGADGAGVFAGSVTNPVPEGAAIVNNLDDALSSTASDVVYIAISPVDLAGKTIDKNLTISTDVSGDVIIAAGYTLTVGGDYTAGTATVNGTLAVTGALNGTVNKTDFANVTGITYTAGTATANDVISMTAGAKEIAQGELEETDTLIPATIKVGAGETVVIAKGVKLVGVSVNGTSLTITAMADMTVFVPKAAEPDAPAQETEGSASAAPASMMVAAYAETPEDEGTAQSDEPTFTITGDFQMDASMTGVDGIEISDATVTSGSEDPETVYEITIATGGTLYLSGTINLDGVKIVVGDNTTLVIAKDAVINGDEGSIELKTGGKIVNNGGTISADVVNATAGSATVTDMTGFLAALPYYDKITVEGTIELVTTDGTSVDYNVDNVDIVLNHGKIVVKENVNLVFNEANVEIKDDVNTLENPDYANIESGITVEGTIQVNNSDIYVDVVADDENVVPGDGNTMNVSGTSTGLGRIGFGNTLVIDDAFTLGNRTGDLLVYGTVQVNSGVALTINQGTTLTVSKSGVLNVDGTVANAGNIVVNGTADIIGAVTVSETGSITGAGTVDVSGTLDMNGTSGVGITIQQDGNVTVNGNVTYGNGTTVTTDDINTGVTIYPGANLNIEKATGTMTITDKGTVPAYKPADKNDTFMPANQDGNTITLVNSANYEITVSIDQKTENYGEKSYTYDIAVMDIAGTAAEGDVTANAVTGLTVAGILDIAKGSFEIAGIDVEITGTVTVAVGATFSSDADLEVAGTVEVSAATAADAEIGGAGKVTATYYDKSTAATGDVAAYVTKTYTTFDNAIGAIAGADETTVTVSGEQAATVSAENIAGTVVINDGAKLTVGAATGDIVVLSFAATGGITNNDTAAYDAVGTDGENVGKNIVVYGELTFADYTKYVEGAGTKAVETPKIDADVAIIETPARTFTTLANAIDMGETDITLNQDVVLTESMEIPAGVTVKGDDKDITIGETDSEKDITLTVKGAVQLTGDGVITQVPGAEIEDSDPADYYEGTLVVDGMGYVYTETDYTGIDNVAGAHYVKTIEVPATTTTAADEYDVYVVSTVDYAAGDSAHVKVVDNVAAIQIVGDAKATDVTFTVPASVDEGVTYTMVITLAEKAALTAGSVNVAPGVTIDGTNGTITGSVVYTDVGTVDLVKVAGAEIQSKAATTGQNALPAMLTIAGTVTGDVTVADGTVTVEGTLDVQNPADERSSSSLTVAADATLDVDGTVTTQDKVPVTVNGTMDVAGTVTVEGKAAVAGTVTDKGTVTFNGETTVNGEIAVEGAEAATSAEADDIAYLTIENGNIAGTIDANVYSDVAIAAVVTGTVNADGTVYISAILGDLGEGSYELGTALTGELNFGADSKVTVDGIQAYYGTTVTGLGDDVKSTAYVINGKTYMTFYAPENTYGIMDIVSYEEFDLTEDGLSLDTGLFYGYGSDKNTGLYDPANWYKTSNMLPNTILTGSEAVGSSATVYAQVEPVPVTVTVTVTNGLTLYLDGQPVNSGSMDLAVGEHTVFIQPQAGYTADEATISFAGQTVVTGTGQATIVLTADMENATIFANGATQTSGDITVNVPEQPVQPSTGGDDGMSLTDYLLIVLVVLIVIMAIIVALRLMRN